MNAKLLYAATVALALASSLAVAADNSKPLARADVVAAWNQAAADRTLRHNDYDYDAHDYDRLSTVTRAEVLADMASSRQAGRALVGPLRNRTYNPGGLEALKVSTLPRAQVKADVVAAMRDGTLRRTDYDDEGVRSSRRVQPRAAGPVLAANGR